METYQKYQDILDNVLLKSGIVTLAGAKDNLGCHLITFQSHQQLLFTQLDYSSLIESLYVAVMYYKSPLISFLVNMSHSSQIFIDHFIHVVDQLERKMSKSEIKRVYIIRPERKSIKKHFGKELGNTKDNKRINAQVVVIKAIDELYQYINVKNLTTEFSGTLQHDHNAWLAVQKMLTQYYVLVGNIASSSSDILQRIRQLTSGDLVTRPPERSTEHAQRKRLRNIEKKKDEMLRQFNFAKAVEDGQRLRSYFQDPRLSENFQALSKSPIFVWDKTRFQQYYRRMLTVNDSIEHAWKEGVDKMTSLITEQGLYDRVIECCTWIVDEGLPYLTSLPAQSKTLAEAVKQKNNFENEFYKPVKTTLKKCRQTLKEVRQCQRSVHTSSGGLEMMADNLKSLMENLKTKTEERMEHYKKENDFMQTLNKTEHWCDRAKDFLAAKQTTSVTRGYDHLPEKHLVDMRDSDKSLEHFLESCPPLTSKELAHLLDYVENIEDFELRNRARLLANRFQELEKRLRALEAHLDDDSGEELRRNQLYDRNSSYQRRLDREDSQTPLRSTISTDISTKRWHTSDDVMTSTTISNDDVSITSPRTKDLGRRPGNDNSRLADIQRRLRDQELLYEQLILEEELRELAEGSGEEKLSLGQTKVGLGSTLNGSFQNGNWRNKIVDSDGLEFEKRNNAEKDEKMKLSGRQAGLSNSTMKNSRKHANSSEKALKKERTTEIFKRTELKSEHVGLTNRSSDSKGENWESLVQPASTCKQAFETGNVRKQGTSTHLRSDSNGHSVVEKWDSLVKPPRASEKHVKTCQGKQYDKNTGLRTDQVELRKVGCLSSKLLDGCDSLKRLCEFENSLTQNGSTFPMLHQNDQGECNDKKADDIEFIQTMTPNNVSLPNYNAPSSENFVSSSFGEPTKLTTSESRDHVQGLRHFEAASHDDSDISRESGKCSRDLRTPSRGFESCSGGSELHSLSYENSSRDLESCSRDPERSRDCMENPPNYNSISCDANEKSHEELVKSAREAVDHWTHIKNEQRVRLAQVIDDVTTRKEIEEIYFNAQIQLCRARQNVAALSKSDNALTKLPLNNDVISCGITSSFNTSSEFQNAGDQMLNGEGAFRRFVKDEANVEEETGDFEGGRQILHDNEESLEMTGGVDHDIGGSIDIKDIPREEMPSEKVGVSLDDRALKQENGDEVDSEEEQGSSDEFDDDVEEEELMLLCSQSSSGLLSQDELKNSLKEEQDKLEDMFRQQKERLRKEREKLEEEEKRIEEWKKEKIELEKGEIGLATNSEERREDLPFDEDSRSNILDKIDVNNKLDVSELHFGQDLQHEQSQHDKLKPEHDIPETVQDISSSQRDVFELNHDMRRSSHNVLAPQHDLFKRQHEMRGLPHDEHSPRHEIVRPQHDSHKSSHDVPAPKHDLPQLELDIPISPHDMPRSYNEQTSPQHAQHQHKHKIYQVLHGRPQVEHGKETALHERLQGVQQVHRERKLLNEQDLLKQYSCNDALREKGETNISSVDPNIDIKLMVPKPTGENFSVENEYKDLNDIAVSNIDSDEESRNKIEEELIKILQETTLETEEGNSKEKDKEFGLNFPPLVDDGNPSCISDNDDIDLMNKLIDDLMFSDQEQANQEDYNKISVDRSQLNGDDHRINEDSNEVNVDNFGISVDNSGLTVDSGRMFQGDLQTGLDNVEINLNGCDGISEGNTRGDVDRGRTSEDNLGQDLDNFGINLNLDVGIKLQYDDRRKKADYAETGEDNERLDVDDVGIHMDVHGINELDIDLGDFEIRNDKSELNANIDGPNFDVGTTGDNLGISVGNHVIDLDNITFGVDKDVRTNGDKISHEDTRAVDHQVLDEIPGNDEMLVQRAANGELNGEFGIDVDFTVDLSKTPERVEGTDLINLLHCQGDAFSSQDSLNVNEECSSDVECELPKTSTTQQNHSDFNEEHSMVSGYTKDQSGITKDEGGITIDQDRIPEDEDGITKDLGGITREQGGIPEGHQLLQASEDSDSSDADFGRVLEDIQEEESEYEDLMRYRGTQMDNNGNQVHEPAKIIVPSSVGWPTTRVSEHNVNKENSVSSSFTSSVIIDPGTGWCKAGFSIDDQPRVVIPSVVGKPRSEVGNSERYKEYYVGEEAKHLHRALDLHHPLKNGIVQDWDLMEKLLDEIYEELRCESDQYPVLLSEPVLNPKSNREELIQVMFESFHVPAAYICAQATLSLFATGRTTGLVYDCGYSKAHCVPVYEGYALPHATMTTELAGHELTTCLSRMLRDRGVSLNGQAELDIVEDIKMKLCYVVMDHDSERKAYNIGERNDATYTMPDGQIISIGSERFRCPEVLFTPSIVGMATDGAHEIIYKTAMQCAIDVRTSLYENIVISGGSTMFPGFSRRLHLELCKLLGTRSPDSVNIDAVDDRNMLTWQGGAMLSKLSNFASMWITSSEYDEFGPGIVHKKCV